MPGLPAANLPCEAVGTAADRRIASLRPVTFCFRERLMDRSHSSAARLEALEAELGLHLEFRHPPHYQSPGSPVPSARSGLVAVVRLLPRHATPHVVRKTQTLSKRYRSSFPRASLIAAVDPRDASAVALLSYGWRVFPLDAVVFPPPTGESLRRILTDDRLVRSHLPEWVRRRLATPLDASEAWASPFFPAMPIGPSMATRRLVSEGRNRGLLTIAYSSPTSVDTPDSGKQVSPWRRQGRRALPMLGGGCRVRPDRS